MIINHSPPSNFRCRITSQS